MKKPYLIHTFLLPVYPVLFYVSHNQKELIISAIILPSLAAIVSALILYGSVLLISRNGFKAGIASSLIIFLFTSYGYFATILSFRLLIHNYVIGPNKVLFCIWIAIAILGIILIYRTEKNLRNLCLILNFIVIVLVGVSLFNMGLYEINRRSVFHERSLKSISEVQELRTQSTARTLDTPDIYYIIMDRYASSNALRNYLEYDNSSFTQYLESKGFYIASRSHSNYLVTSLSLASSLNMEYLDYLQDNAGSKRQNYMTVFAMLQDYKVWRFLKTKRYKFIHIGSWYDVTKVNKYADMNFNYDMFPRLSQFHIKLLQTTALRPFMKSEYEERAARNRTLYQFEKLSQVSRMPEPKFVFAHLLIPHQPQVFGKHGETLKPSDIKHLSKQELYINQLAFTNKKMRQVVDEILENSKTKPIIILQSDEGPRTGKDEDLGELIGGKDAAQIHAGIFNAYYFPGFDKSSLYKDISPVNTFRVVFNNYFGTKLKLLEDNSYAIGDSDNPFRFKRIDATN